MNLRQDIRDRLADSRLREALARALETARSKRLESVGELRDFSAAQSTAATIRQNNVQQLQENLTALEKQWLEAGTHVLWATDAQQVHAHLQEITDRHQTRKVILSKSMVGEEVELEKALQAMGITVTQTDLGERVVQLAGQRPSHITAPCVHMSATEVGEVLSSRAGITRSDDPEILSRGLAKVLRKHFLEADLGISGANLMVAETGTMVCVENEGNLRMGYTIPDVHVVITGIEKAVGTMAEAEALLTLLARSATGQRLTSYTSLIGPAPLPGQTRYVILVDNKRTTLFNSGPFRDLLRCIRCGACMNVCPVYEMVGGHAYRWIYPGPIGIAMAPFAASPDVGQDLPDLCSLCGACQVVCPVGIPLERLIVLARQHANRLKPAGAVRRERRGFKWMRRAMGGPWRYRFSHWGHRQTDWFFPKKIRALQDRLGWGGNRTAPEPAQTSFRQWMKGHKGEKTVE